MWKCKCDCGTESAVSGTALRTGASKSCGCLTREVNSVRRKSHGMTNTKFYKAWQNMLDRCNNENSVSYKDYGGRGIFIYDRWAAFENFKEDMYESYLKHVESFGAKNTSIDRINNNEGYSKENCRWATSKIQMRNRRMDRRNKSGYPGVSSTGYGTWRAAITDSNGVQRRIGTFKTVEEAIQARIDAEKGVGA